MPTGKITPAKATNRDGGSHIHRQGHPYGSGPLGRYKKVTIRATPNRKKGGSRPWAIMRLSKNVENPRDRNGHVSKKRNAKKGDEKAVKRRVFRFGPCHGTCIGIKSACRSNCVGRLYP